MMKLLSCRYNMDTNRVEARFADDSAVAIDCIAIEDEYGNTPAQRAELDWLLYNKPLEYAQLVLGGEIEHYLSLSCDHGRFRGSQLVRTSESSYRLSCGSLRLLQAHRELKLPASGLQQAPVSA